MQAKQVEQQDLGAEGGKPLAPQTTAPAPYAHHLDAGVAEDLHDRFYYYRPTESRRLRHARLSELYVQLAAVSMSMTPKGREQSPTRTHLKESRVWAPASVPR